MYQKTNLIMLVGLLSIITGCANISSTKTDSASHVPKTQEQETSSAIINTPMNSISDTKVKPLVKKDDIVQFGKISIPKDAVEFLNYYPLGKKVNYVLTDGMSLDSWVNSFEDGTSLVESTNDNKRDNYLKGSSVVYYDGKIDKPSYKIYSLNPKENEMASYGQINNDGTLKWNESAEIEYPLTIQFGKEY